MAPSWESSSSSVAFLYKLRLIFSSNRTCRYTDQQVATQCVQHFVLQQLMVYSSEFGIHVDQMRIPRGCQCGLSVAGTANIPPSQTQTTSSSGAPPPGSSSSPATQSERAPYATPTVL
ncbi:hypothetical protein BV898_19782 [Hypsibius exemplaris]|uniref:Spaetzle domain-containing protein n=1 Tax=Hypsibius exemplaris TaxID=2072580 RepID=A0A9X6NM71_HYPEX|nr:hypothetical protein BV898_19782 [Hypsibius exemplaris]